MSEKQSNVVAIDLRQAVAPEPVEKKGYGTAKYVTFGEDNKYPDFLLHCYDECSILQSIINGLSDYVAGSGFVVGNAERIVNEKGETYLSLVQRCAVDYIIFGAFTIGIRRDKEHRIAFLDYHDPRTIRLNEDGDEAYYCKDWSKSNRRVISTTQHKSVKQILDC